MSVFGNVREHYESGTGTGSERLEGL